MTATPESRLSDYCDAWESAGTAGPVDMIDGAALYVSDLRAVLAAVDAARKVAEITLPGMPVTREVLRALDSLRAALPPGDG
jgi:hypothetical protein